jgi:shikimate dehydrogenase
MNPRVYFLGVRTVGSASHRAFPAWVQAIGWSASLVGIDIPLDSPCPRYREFVKRMRNDGACAGAQVTSHKVRIFDCLAEELDILDSDTHFLGEVGAISTARGKLSGFSPDMLAVGEELSRLLIDETHNIGSREVVILGGGGAGRAVALASIRLGKSIVSKITITERNDTIRTDLESRLEGSLHGSDLPDLEVHDSTENDDIVAHAPAGSLIVNATGLGKDIEGSPISPRVIFPWESIAWDLNYRGDLRFLTHARSQSRLHGIRVADGWNYFLRNWYMCLTRLAGRTPSEEGYGRFCDASGFLRPGRRT